MDAIQFSSVQLKFISRPDVPDLDAQNIEFGALVRQGLVAEGEAGRADAFLD